MACKSRSDFSKEKYPRLWEYLAMLESSNSYKRAVEKIVTIDGYFEPNL